MSMIENYEKRVKEKERNESVNMMVVWKGQKRESEKDESGQGREK